MSVASALSSRHPVSSPSASVLEAPILRFSYPLCATVLKIPQLRAATRGPCPVCAGVIVASPLVDTPSMAVGLAPETVESFSEGRR